MNFSTKHRASISPKLAFLAALFKSDFLSVMVLLGSKGCGLSKRMMACREKVLQEKI